MCCLKHLNWHFKCCFLAFKIPIGVLIPKNFSISNPKTDIICCEMDPQVENQQVSKICHRRDIALSLPPYYLWIEIFFCSKKYFFTKMDGQGLKSFDCSFLNHLMGLILWLLLCEHIFVLIKKRGKRALSCGADLWHCVSVFLELFMVRE